MLEPSTDLRVLRGRATRERILDEATKLFGGDGYEATSIEDILRATGVQRGALYHHFPSKSALFEAVLDRTTTEVTDRILGAVMAAPDPLEALRAGCLAWLELALEPEVQRIVLLDPLTAIGWQRQRQIDGERVLGGMRLIVGWAAGAFAGHVGPPPPGTVEAAEVDAVAHMVMVGVSEISLYVALSEDSETAHAGGRAAVNRMMDALSRSWLPGHSAAEMPAEMAAAWQAAKAAAAADPDWKPPPG